MPSLSQWQHPLHARICNQLGNIVVQQKLTCYEGSLGLSVESWDIWMAYTPSWSMLGAHKQRDLQPIHSLSRAVNYRFGTYKPHHPTPFD
jgi:hypothetical protein